MQVTQAIQSMCAASGLTHRQIAGRLGKYDTYVSQMITRRTDPQTSTLADLARACGYSLQLVPMDGGEAITIGDDSRGTDAQPTISDARAMIARGLAMLEAMDE